MMKKMNNAEELEAEINRLRLRREKLLRNIKKNWGEIKEEGTPATLATEMALNAIAGNSATGKILMNSAEFILRYLKK